MKLYFYFILLTFSLLSFSQKIITSNLGEIIVNENSLSYNYENTLKNVKSLLLPNYKSLIIKSNFKKAYKFLKNNNFKKVIFIVKDETTLSKGILTSNSQSIDTFDCSVENDLKSIDYLLNNNLCQLNCSLVDNNYDVFKQISFIVELFGNTKFQFIPIIIGQTTKNDLIRFGNSLKKIVDNETLIIGIKPFENKIKDISSTKLIINEIYKNNNLNKKQIYLGKDEKSKNFAELLIDNNKINQLNLNKNKNGFKNLSITKNDIKILNKITQNSIKNYLNSVYLQDYKKVNIKEKLLTKNLKSKVIGLHIKLYNIDVNNNISPQGNFIEIFSNLPLYKVYENLLIKAFTGNDFLSEFEAKNFINLKISLFLLKRKYINNYELINNKKDIIMLQMEDVNTVTFPIEYNVNPDYNIKEHLKKMSYDMGYPLNSFENIHSQISTFNPFFSTKFKPSRMVMKRYVYKFSDNNKYTFRGHKLSHDEF